MINSAIIKLGKLTIACKVFRGISGRVLPEQFWQPNEFGVKGGIESAFMSTTSDRAVAVQYAGGGGAGFVFEIQQGMVDRGADISWLSQYPHEREILFAPLTGLEVQATWVDGATLIIGVSLSINLTALTIERVVAKRRTVLEEMWGNMLSEVRLALLEQGSVAAVLESNAAGGGGGAPAAAAVEAEIDVVVIELQRRLHEGPLGHPPEHYNDDPQLQAALDDILNLKAQFLDPVYRARWLAMRPGPSRGKRAATAVKLLGWTLRWPHATSDHLCRALDSLRRLQAPPTEPRDEGSLETWEKEQLDEVRGRPGYTAAVDAWWYAPPKESRESHVDIRPLLAPFVGAFGSLFMHMDASVRNRAVWVMSMLDDGESSAGRLPEAEGWSEQVEAHQVGLSLSSLTSGILSFDENGRAVKSHRDGAERRIKRVRDHLKLLELRTPSDAAVLVEELRATRQEHGVAALDYALVVLALAVDDDADDEMRDAIVEVMTTLATKHQLPLNCLAEPLLRMLRRLYSPEHLKSHFKANPPTDWPAGHPCKGKEPYDHTLVKLHIDLESWHDVIAYTPHMHAVQMLKLVPHGTLMSHAGELLSMLEDHLIISGPAWSAEAVLMTLPERELAKLAPRIAGVLDRCATKDTKRPQDPPHYGAIALPPLRLLGACGSAAIVTHIESLLPCLASRSIREVAESALAKLDQAGLQQVAPALLARWGPHSAKLLARLDAAALRQHEDAIKQRLRDGDECMRIQALGLLCRFAAAEHLPLLVQKLQVESVPKSYMEMTKEDHEREERVETALQALGWLDAAALRPHRATIKDMCKDGRYSVREAALALVKSHKL